MESPIFATHLEQIRSSSEVKTSIQFQAMRANKFWCYTELSVLMYQLHDPAVLARLHIDDDGIGLQASPGARERFSEFFELTGRTCAERAWFNKNFSDTCSEQLAGLLDTDPDRAQDCLERVRDTAELMIHARRVKSDVATHHNDRTDTSCCLSIRLSFGDVRSSL